MGGCAGAGLQLCVLGVGRQPGSPPWGQPHGPSFMLRGSLSSKIALPHYVYAVSLNGIIGKGFFFF